MDRNIGDDKQESTERDNRRAKVIQPNSDSLSEAQKWQFSLLIDEYEGIFAMNNSDLGKPDIIEHEINTGEHAPIKQLPRRIPPHKREIIDQQLDELLANGRVEESQSAWSSPVVLVRKHDGSYCICIDYRKLNLCIEKDAIPLPRTNDVLEASGIWVLADASKRRGQTQNSVLDPSWTIPMEG